MSQTILILGACGQIGGELTEKLRAIYGRNQVIASDIRKGNTCLMNSGPFEIIDATNKEAILTVVKKYQVTQVYLLAAILSATGETYPKKAWIYVMRQGKAQFSQGGLAHDVMNSINEFGLVPSYVYSGLKEGQEGHDHSKLVKELKKTLEVYLKDTKAYKTDWKQDIATILDNTIGNDVTHLIMKVCNIHQSRF